jgi:hypothetical protein
VNAGDFEIVINPSFLNRPRVAAFAASLVFLSSAFAEIISPDRRVDWIPGVTVGVQTPIPVRTNLIDVTKAPYNADRSGAANASSAIQAAIEAAASNDVVYLPAGRYRLNNIVTVNKSYVTLRGDGPNTVLLGLGNASSVLSVGHGALSPDPFRSYVVVGGAVKGSTNLLLSSVGNGYGDTLKPGDALILSTATRNTGTEAMPVFSVANFDRIIKQFVIVHSRNGNSVSITAPLVWDFTNAPMLGEVDTLTQPRRMVGIENLSITLTNNGQVGTAGFMVDASCLRDSWFKNLDLGFANNYQIYLRFSANCQIQGNTIHDPLSYGTSHAGMIMADVTGILVEDNVFTSNPARGLQLFPAIEINDGVMGCAFAFNYFTNNASDIHTHNSHPMMNLIEGNVVGSFFQMDGYFGSASHYTLFRNRLVNTVVMKKFTSNMQIVGNVIGVPGGTYVYSKEESGYGPPWPLFEMGYPNIGNSSFRGTSPSMAWNFPGKTLIPFLAPYNPIPNGIFTFTNDQLNTNILWGNFTNIPAPYAGGYSILFQDGVNTNRYYGATNGQSLLTLSAGTSSNLVLNSHVSVSNGWTIYIAGQQAYQQLQAKVTGQ